MFWSLLLLLLYSFLISFDIMLDYKLKPWLLEINSSPSFTTDTPFDLKIKKGVIIDALNLIMPNKE